MGYSDRLQMPSDDLELNNAQPGFVQYYWTSRNLSLKWLNVIDDNYLKGPNENWNVSLYGCDKVFGRFVSEIIKVITKPITINIHKAFIL